MDNFNKGTTIYLYADEVKQYDPETDASTDLASPTSVTFRVRVNGTTTEIAGDQSGTDNDWYAEYACPTVGEVEWQVEFVKNSKKSFTPIQRFLVKDSLPDV